MHTGSHKLNNALGQALLARRMGKTRIIAETGAGQHGVASATVCALLGVECVVYMGAEDIRRQQPNVQRMELLGARVVSVEAGARTLKEAVSEAIRDWVTNVADTHYIIGSAVGPAPYPGDRPRPAARDRRRGAGAARSSATGRLPDRAIACVGGGSNSIGMFAGFVDDAGVELVGVEAAGEGLETGRHGAPLTVGGRPGVLHGSLSAILQDDEGQIREAHSVSAGPRLPGLRARARLAARLGPRAVRRRERRRRAGDVPPRHAARGDHPGARDLPRAALRARCRPRAGSTSCAARGAGDKDLAEVLARP